MSYIKNLDRDMIWGQELSALTEGTAFAFNASVIVKTSGALQERHGYMNTARADLSAGGSEFCAFGLVMNQPVSGREAYRVKAALPFQALSGYFGYGYTSSVSTLITIANPRIIGAGFELDEIVCIPNNGNPTHSVVFFLMCSTDIQDFWAFMNVQALLGKPDPYQSAVR